MRKYSYSKIKPMNITELTKFCKQLNGKTLKESVAIGAKIGLSRHLIHALRQILGYSENYNKPRFTLEQREEIAREYCEDNVTMQHLAAKYKVHYNSIRCLLKARDITIRHPKEWTVRQEKYLEFEYNRGSEIKKIAEAVGKTYASVCMKINRMISENKLKRRVNKVA